MLERDEFFLDPRAVRRSFDAASETYDAAAVIQGEIRNRLLERLDIVRLRPGVVLDLGAGTGHAARALKRRYPGALVIALDVSERMLAQAARQQRLFRRFERIAGDAGRLPLKDASVDLVFSNLLLEWCADPDAIFREIRRVLRPDGVCTFTTLGPDTLKELRDAWRRADERVHVHRFIDMHDLGDALVRGRFAEPVMDTERLTVTFADTHALMRELQASGSGNIALGRRRGLTTRARLARAEGHGDRAARDGVLAVSVEVIYGQAWVGQTRAPAAPGGEFLFSLESLRRARKP